MVGTRPHKVLGINPDSIHSVIELIPAPVFVSDSEGLLSNCNQSFRQLFQLDENCIGKALEDLLPDPLPQQLKAAENHVSPEGMTIVEATFIGSRQIPRSVRIQQCRFANKRGRTGGNVGLIFDVTEDTRRFDRLRQLSIIDELTALPNRRHGLERVQNLLQQSQRNEFTFSFLILDIDDFKAVNDYEGHQAGDVVLKDIADIIQELCRSYDLAFRYGGDEFIICLPNTDPTAAAAFAERIRSAIEKHLFVLQDSTEISTTVSIGIANFPADGDSMELLLSAADKALYDAKQQGRNRVICASTPPLRADLLP
jgi:diguanylate cyclase (GGDEF)-like protein